MAALSIAIACSVLFLFWCVVMKQIIYEAFVDHYTPKKVVDEQETQLQKTIR